ncbi:MAG: hypothetical protein CVV24_12090 [Ignavibacteriae bacterium HGW-Ignavibacteriae-3]|nr:MAG: hypothetical protein CVV24_12090 [Ignavibacteriae bacterium HGW-Ignavibacteriae-3]
MIIKNIKSLVLFLISVCSLNAQETIKPELNNAILQKGWKGYFHSAELIRKDSSPAVLITKTDDDDLMWLEDFEFINGTVEFDAKGKSAPPQSSFIGIAFNVIDENNYDAVYFRPFNFRSPNSLNKAHAVQYI